MCKGWRLLVVAVGAMLLTMGISSCSSGSSRYGEVASGDKLTRGEIAGICDHARNFIRKQAGKLRVSPEEMAVIANSEPRVRVSYNGHKRGRMSLEWVFPQKQFFAIAQGDLRDTRDWHVYISKKAEVIYYQKKDESSANAPGQINPKEFESLLNK